MSKVSGCCHREIIKRHGMEYPLGGSTWGQSYTYDACSCCGNEVYDYVKTCDDCGEVVCDCVERKAG